MLGVVDSFVFGCDFAFPTSIAGMIRIARERLNDPIQ